MESILAAISVVSLLAAMTAWSFAWKISKGWADFSARTIESMNKMNSDWANIYELMLEERRDYIKWQKESR